MRIAALALGGAEGIGHLGLQPGSASRPAFEAAIVSPGSSLFMADLLAERALRGIALGRKAWLFAGSDRGDERAPFMYGLIATAKLNEIDPQAWLADVLARIAGTPASRLDDLLPWNWTYGAAASAA